MTQKPNCDHCKELYKPDCNFCELERKKENCEPCREKNKPDCEKCFQDLKIPILMEENIPAYKVYTRVKEQHIMGFNGPVSLNLNAVYPVMDMIGIEEEDRLRCLDLLQLLYYEVRIPKYLQDKKAKEPDG